MVGAISQRNRSPTIDRRGSTGKSRFRGLDSARISPHGTLGVFRTQSVWLQLSLAQLVIEVVDQSQRIRRRVARDRAASSNRKNDNRLTVRQVRVSEGGAERELADLGWAKPD